MSQKFYKTTIQLEVLSEEPIPGDMSLASILKEADTGDYCSQEIDRVEKELTGKEAADCLYAIGSEPAFFGIDDEGESLADGFYSDEAHDFEEWIISHENTGESVQEGFLSEHDAYQWLKANLDTLQPPEMSEYVIAKAEKE